MTISTESERQEPPGAEVPPGDKEDDLPATACDLAAIAAEQRAAHQARVEHLWFEAAQEVRELPDGYGFRFSADEFPTIAEFIANERLCCPFFNFGLEVTPERGPVWLRLTGREGVKDFLRPMLNQRG